MVRIFFVECPDCGERFHAHFDELRNTGIELWCPRCGSRFLDSESPEILE